MATWAPATKASTSFSNQGKSTTIPAGTPIGLLLVLTYAEAILSTTGQGSAPVWTEQTKN